MLFRKKYLYNAGFPPKTEVADLKLQSDQRGPMLD